MPNIVWDETLPRDSDYYSGYPTAHKSLMSTFASAIANSIDWPGSGGSLTTQAGIMKLGSFRAYHAAQSAFSVGSPVTTGTLFYASDQRRLFAVGSAATIFCGSWRAHEAAAETGATNVRWVSVSTTTSSSFLTVPYGFNFNGLPSVQLSLQTDLQDEADAASAISTPLPLIVSSTSSQVVYRFYPPSVDTVGITVHLLSQGTVTF